MLLKKCGGCGVYTMGEKCPSCGVAAVNPHPAKYSVPDKYAEYRRKAKYPELFLQEKS